MNRIIIVMLFLCIGFIGSGCYKKDYSVEEFKKDEKLLSEWIRKCEQSEESVKLSQNCKNAGEAFSELLLGY